MIFQVFQCLWEPCQIVPLKAVVEVDRPMKLKAVVEVDRPMKAPSMHIQHLIREKLSARVWPIIA